jgi:hypothetical protein
MAKRKRTRNESAEPMKPFTEDDIKRTGLPADVFGLLHDLCYHVNNKLRGTLDARATRNYVSRAQRILAQESSPDEVSNLLVAIEVMKSYITNDKHVPWNNVLHFADRVKKSYRKT